MSEELIPPPNQFPEGMEDDIRYIQRLDSIFKEHGARLEVQIGLRFAKVIIGNMELVFLVPKDQNVSIQPGETLKGKVEIASLPYDGWGVHQEEVAV